MRDLQLFCTDLAAMLVTAQDVLSLYEQGGIVQNLFSLALLPFCSPLPLYNIYNFARYARLFRSDWLILLPVTVGVECANQIEKAARQSKVSILEVLIQLFRTPPV